MNICGSDAHKGEQVVVIVLPLIRQILLVSLTNEVVAAVIVERVLGEGRCGIELGDACGCDRIGGLDVALAVVDAHDQKICCIFSCDTPPYIDLVFGSEIWSLSREPEIIISLFWGLVAAWKLHESCTDFLQTTQI